MKQTCKKLSALLLVLILSLSLCVPALAAEEAKGLNAAAQEAAAAAMTYGAANQIAWAVWQDGKITASGSQAKPAAEGQDPSPVKGSVYGIGSVSKIYTTVAVMQLAEAGKLELDQPVVKYLPEFKMADERYKSITVRMLLNHSSGLMGSSMGSALLFDDASGTATGELLERLSTQRLKADPGAYSVYCNDGFTLAELVVEAVSGVSFQDYLHANILDPAGLDETWFPGDSFEDLRADIYQAGDERPLPKDCLGVVGTGGIYATAEGLAAFGGALTGEALLKKASLDAMAAPEYAKGLWPEETPDALSYGLGWDSVEWFPFSQNGITALVKGGDTQYYHAGLVVIPEHNMAAAVLTSGGVSTYNEMAASQMLAAALREKGVTIDESPLTLPEAKPASMPRELTELSGYYGSLYVYKIDVVEDGKLTMHYLNMPDVPDQIFTYYSDGSFRDANNVSALRLVKEDNGQIYLYQRAFASLPGLGGLPSSNYAAMKLPENQITPELQDRWDTLMGMSVLPMNERYSSQIYLALGSLLLEETEQTEGAPGYIGAMRIEDEAHARYAVQIPGNVGRDGSDMEIRQDENGVFWFYQSTGSVYMDMSAIPTLSAGKDNTASCTIQPNGYARWYYVGSTASGKKLTVQLPDNAGFWVYDGEGTVTASSVLWDDTSTVLPENGLIVFAGDPGAEFQLTFS